MSIEKKAAKLAKCLILPEHKRLKSIRHICAKDDFCGFDPNMMVVTLVDQSTGKIYSLYRIPEQAKEQQMSCLKRWGNIALSRALEISQESNRVMFSKIRFLETTASGESVFVLTSRESRKCFLYTFSIDKDGVVLQGVRERDPY